MAIHPAIVSMLFKQTVTIAPKTGTSTDGYNKPTFGTAVSYLAKIEMSSENVRVSDNEEKISSRKIFINTQTAPDTDDLLTLPAGFEPLTPKILEVRTISDNVGINHIVLIT